MLKTLRISNYAIINEVEIGFSADLNIITGETGAGKSILLGALSLITGERADSKVLFNKEKKCVVEAVFDIKNYHLESFFSAENIDHETETIIRRELTDNGKSRAFINDTPVTLNVLQQLADKLITIHSQHETLALGESRFQLTVIDALANTEKNLSEYKNDFYKWKEISKQLAEAETAAAKAITEKDFIEFQFNELENAQLDNINQPELENELQQLTHAEEIKKNIFSSVELLETAPGNIIDNLRSVILQLQSVLNYSSDLQQYPERLRTTSIELKDITRDLSAKADTISADPKRAEEINQILSIVFRLQKKHNLKTTEELVVLRDALNEKLFAFNSSEETIEKLKKEKRKLFVTLCIKAKKISDKRISVFASFEKQVQKLLDDVGMKDAAFIIQHTFDTEKYLTETGADIIQFLFSANKGSVPQDIKKVASGGELSRLMLSIKSLIAKSTALPTLIFDEIDTGVSGSVANKVGNILHQLSAQHQVIAITHLAQIASKGTHHLYVYKSSSASSTNTHIKLLNKEERLTEIATMLSGEKPSQSAIHTAKELLAV
ncbi:MAG: DNA repair protein RecN [Fimbriimonadaceae bacterium]|nr:DNA repair protein RecN [Chitinophagales bacterium]